MPRRPAPSTPRRTAPLPQEVRIIGGQWRRTRLPVADRPGLRPTPDRVRETLFNWLVHDGIGVWLAARRLNSGKFFWPREGALTATLNQSQFDALVLGLPWQRLGDGGVITVI